MDFRLGLREPLRAYSHTDYTLLDQRREVVDILVRFDAFAGRYMYHCHILEHEDHDMMRPFVVMPAELMSFM
jgi:FtsP/CotA-like multicopper oxidase with cupredoxin domain